MIERRHKHIHLLACEEASLERLIGEVACGCGHEGHEVIHVVLCRCIRGQRQEDLDGERAGHGGLAILGDEEGEDLAEVGDERGVAWEVRGGEERDEVGVEARLRAKFLGRFYSSQYLIVSLCS